MCEVVWSSLWIISRFWLVSHFTAIRHHKPFIQTKNPAPHDQPLGSMDPKKTAKKTKVSQTTSSMRIASASPSFSLVATSSCSSVASVRCCWPRVSSSLSCQKTGWDAHFTPLLKGLPFFRVPKTWWIWLNHAKSTFLFGWSYLRLVLILKIGHLLMPKWPPKPLQTPPRPVVESDISIDLKSPERPLPESQQCRSQKRCLQQTRNTKKNMRKYIKIHSNWMQKHGVFGGYERNHKKIPQLNTEIKIAIFSLEVSFHPSYCQLWGA